MFVGLYVLGFEISYSQVCVLGFASLVLSMGCVGGQGVLKVCFQASLAFVQHIVYCILYIQCSKQRQLCCMLAVWSY